MFFNKIGIKHITILTSALLQQYFRNEVRKIKSILFSSFNNDLQNEAKRISNILLEEYSKNVKFNMSFENIVRKFLKKEYKYYEVDITSYILFYKPNDLRIDPLNEYVFVTQEEFELRHISNYVSYCLNKRKNKNPKIAANKFALLLIEMEKKNQIKNLGLHEILYKNMSILYPNHHDSVDAKALILCLQDAIEDIGYTIDQVNPLIIKENNMIKNE